MRWRPIPVLMAVALPVAVAWAGEPRVAAPSDHEIATRAHQLLTTYEAYGFSGAALIALDGRVVFADGYGFANRETGERNTAQTRFDFASIAKTFTGAATLALEAEGKLSVDDRLEKYLGPFPEQKSAATIYHLATHTAGLAHQTRSELDYSPDRAVWVESMKEAPFESPPGSRYRYTNAGTSLLAALVEEVAGEPYEAFVRKRLIEPAGLESTGFYFEFERGAPGIALGYRDDGGSAAPAEYEGWNWGLRGSTGVLSTVGDIHAWYQALRSGRLIPAEQLARAFDPEQTEAFGWHTETDDSGRAFIHKGGGLSAMSSQLLAYPDQGLVIVWAANTTARNWRRALNDGLSSLGLGEPYLLPPMLEAPAKAEPALAGWWTTEEGTRLELVNGGEGLEAGGNGIGIPGGVLPRGDGSWISFDVERVSYLSLAALPDGTLRVVLEPEKQALLLRRETSPRPAAVPLAEPNEASLGLARRVVDWILHADAQRLWEVSAYRPVRGANSREDWERRIGFLAGQVGNEAHLIEESWARRDGSWRYWRTFEADSGIQVVLRLGLSADGSVLSYGLNPLGSEPEADERVAVVPAEG